MIVENHALWGEEPTEDYPATFTYPRVPSRCPTSPMAAAPR